MTTKSRRRASALIVFFEKKFLKSFSARDNM
jgi:hypothetical protein